MRCAAASNTGVVQVRVMLFMCTCARTQFMPWVAHLAHILGAWASWYDRPASCSLPCGAVSLGDLGVTTTHAIAAVAQDAWALRLPAQMHAAANAAIMRMQ